MIAGRLIAMMEIVLWYDSTYSLRWTNVLSVLCIYFVLTDTDVNGAVPRTEIWILFNHVYYIGLLFKMLAWWPSQRKKAIISKEYIVFWSDLDLHSSLSNQFCTYHLLPIPLGHEHSGVLRRGNDRLHLLTFPQSLKIQFDLCYCYHMYTSSNKNCLCFERIYLQNAHL